MLRGPVGALRRAFEVSIPKWVVLSLSFMGSSSVEILCHEDLTDRLVAGMKLLGFRHLPKFNPAGLNSSGKYTDSEWAQLRACYRRWSSAAFQTTSPVSKAWYEEKVRALLAGEPSLAKKNQARAAAQTESEDSVASKAYVEASSDQ